MSDTLAGRHLALRSRPALTIV